MIRTVNRATKRDPNFLRKVFVAHYCNIPFEKLDKKTARVVAEQGVLPDTLIKELYMASVHTIRSFELAPYAPVKDNIENVVRGLIDSGKL